LLKENVCPPSPQKDNYELLSGLSEVCVALSLVVYIVFCRSLFVDANCLLKNTTTKYEKYVVNQKLEHVDDISFRELFGRIKVFWLFLCCESDVDSEEL
jgi:hypothetical protein